MDAASLRGLTQFPRSVSLGFLKRPGDAERNRIVRSGNEDALRLTRAKVLPDSLKRIVE